MLEINVCKPCPPEILQHQSETLPSCQCQVHLKINHDPNPDQGHHWCFAHLRDGQTNTFGFHLHLLSPSCPQSGLTRNKKEQLHISWNILLDIFFPPKDLLIVLWIWSSWSFKSRRPVVMYCRHLREREVDRWQEGITCISFALGIKWWFLIPRNNLSSLKVCLSSHHSSRTALLGST